MALRHLFTTAPKGFRKRHLVDSIKFTDVMDPQTTTCICNFELCFDTETSRYRFAGQQGEQGFDVVRSTVDDSRVKSEFEADGFLGVTPDQGVTIVTGGSTKVSTQTTGPVKTGSVYLKKK